MKVFLDEWMTLRGFTQERLADRTKEIAARKGKKGVDKSTVNRIAQTGKGQPDKLGLIAQALEIEYEKLFRDPTPEPAKQTLEELLEGFDAAYLSGELTDEQILDRWTRLRALMKSRGMG